MNTHILLVEGTSGTGKSTLIKHLLTRHVLEEERPRTLVHLSQAHTYFPLVSPDFVPPPGKRAQREQLRRLLRMVDPQGAPFFALIDTLHLTHAFRPAILRWSELGYVDRELDRFGARMVFLKASPHTLRNRLSEAVQAYSIKEQEQMEALARKSQLPVLFLDVEEGSGAIVEKAYRFWKMP